MARPKRAHPEETLQRQVAHFLDSHLAHGAVWFHPPNGGGRSKAEAGALKAQGVKPGIPDILIFCNGTVVFIELKAPKGYPSPAQRDMHARLRAAGYQVGVARSLADFLALMAEFGVPLRHLRIAA